MVPHIPAPIQGQPLKSSWGAAVAESCNAMRQIGAGGLVRDGAGGFGMEQLPANHRDRRASLLIHPYKVQHFFKEENGSEAKTGAWAIYLPAGPICVVDGKTYDPSKNLTAAGERLGERWFILDAIPEEGGIVWLNIAKSESDDKGTLSFSNEASGEHSFAIASASYADNTTTINQYILSAIISSSNGEGSSVAVDSNIVVGISLDYIISAGDKDYEEHPCAIRLMRGFLALENGILTVKQDDNLTQFIDTIKYSDLGSSS